MHECRRPRRGRRPRGPGSGVRHRVESSWRARTFPLVPLPSSSRIGRLASHREEIQHSDSEKVGVKDLQGSCLGRSLDGESYDPLFENDPFPSGLRRRYFGRSSHDDWSRPLSAAPSGPGGRRPGSGKEDVAETAGDGCFGLSRSTVFSLWLINSAGLCESVSRSHLGPVM